MQIAKLAEIGASLGAPAYFHCTIWRVPLTLQTLALIPNYLLGRQ